MALLYAQALLGEYFSCDPNGDPNMGGYVPRWASILGASRRLTRALAPRIIHAASNVSSREFGLLYSCSRATTIYVNQLHLKVLPDEPAFVLLSKLRRLTPYLRELTLHFCSPVLRSPVQWKFLSQLGHLRYLRIGYEPVKFGSMYASTTSYRAQHQAFEPLQRCGITDAFLTVLSSGCLPDLRELDIPLEISMDVSPAALHQCLSTLHSLRIVSLSLFVAKGTRSSAADETFLARTFCFQQQQQLQQQLSQQEEAEQKNEPQPQPQQVTASRPPCMLRLHTLNLSCRTPGLQQQLWNAAEGAPQRGSIFKSFCPELRSLRIEYTEVRSLAGIEGLYLEHVKLTTYSRRALSPACLTSLFALRELQDLELDDGAIQNNTLSEEVLQGFACLPHLRRLSIGSAVADADSRTRSVPQGFTDNDLGNILANCPSLLYLCVPMMALSARSLGKKAGLPLHRLCIRSSSLRSIDWLLSACPGLVFLDLPDDDINSMHFIRNLSDRTPLTHPLSRISGVDGALIVIK